MSKASKENNLENFVLTLPLIANKQQSDLLNKRFEMLRKIYNAFQWKMLRIYKFAISHKAYKECLDETGKIIPDKRPARNKFLKNFTIDKKDKNGNNIKIFSRSGFQIYVKVFAKSYAQYGLNSHILEKVAINAWSAWEKFLFKGAKKIHFKYDEVCSSYSVRKACGCFNGIKSNKINDGIIGINFSNKNNAKEAKFEYFSYDIKTDYEKECFLNNIISITIKREFIRGKWKFFIQFAFEGKKPQKNRKIGQGTVGLDMGPSTYMCCADDVIVFDELAKNVDDTSKKLCNIQRKMDRSRYATNPEQYNDDKTIKKFKKGTRPKWVKSNHYKRLQYKFRNLCHKKKVAIKNSHIALANMMLMLGDTFIVENNPYWQWQKKAKETTVNSKGRYNSKKRYGKSLLNHAPAMFIEILKNKVVSLGGKFYKVDIHNAASQYDFTNGEFTKRDRSVRTVTLSNGNQHMRDSIAAYNLKNLIIAEDEEEQLKNYNVDELKADYDRFVRNEKEAMELYVATHSKINKNFGIFNTKNLQVSK